MSRLATSSGLLSVPQRKEQGHQQTDGDTILVTQVPTTWAALGYPQMAPLSSWVAGLQRRLQHIRRWLLLGLPNCIWLPGLFSPASFLVALLHESARQRHLPAEQLSLRIEATKLRSADYVKQVQLPLMDLHAFSACMAGCTAGSYAAGCM